MNAGPGEGPAPDYGVAFSPPNARTGPSPAPARSSRSWVSPSRPRRRTPVRPARPLACDTGAMATKADFTDEEWKTLQGGVTGAATYVATVDRSFFDSFKEASALAHHLRDAHQQSDSALIRDIASGHERPVRPHGVPGRDRAQHRGHTRAGRRHAHGEGARRASGVQAARARRRRIGRRGSKGVSAQENTALDHVRAALDAAGQS